MTSTYSPSLRFELPGDGEQSGAWGVTANRNIGTLIESAIAGVASVTHDDSANYTLTAFNGVDDEARHMVQEIGGTLTAARNVVVPDDTKVYIVKNATTGGYAITVKTSAGTGVSIANGDYAIVYSDGTNVVSVVNSGSFGGALAVLDTVGTAQIDNDAITTAKILDANVTTAKIADSNVTTAKIADANVTTAKILDANVTTAKIADANVTTAKIADDNVTTAKIADSNVTLAKIQDIADNRFLGNDTGLAAAPEEITPTEATAMLDVAVGDSGAGGTKGLVPAPASGDATAGKVKLLGAGMTYIRPTWQPIEEVTGTGATLATANGDLATYNFIRIMFRVKPSSDDILTMQMATSGPSWVAGSSYNTYFVGHYLLSSGTNNNLTASAVGGGSSARLTDTSGTYDVDSIGCGCFGWIEIYNTTDDKLFHYYLTYESASSGRFVGTDRAFGFITNTSAITNLRLGWAGAANFSSGSYMVVEGRKFG